MKDLKLKVEVLKVKGYFALLVFMSLAEKYGNYTSMSALLFLMQKKSSKAPNPSFTAFIF